MINTLKAYKSNPFGLLKLLLTKFTLLLDDKSALKILYYLNMGKRLSLKNPKTFSEKLQWIKLYGLPDNCVEMVDKYLAKEYVRTIIGDEYIIPTLGVWDSFDEIDFDTLPQKFVLKTNHDSGGIVICKDKSKLNKKAARDKLTKSLQRNYGHLYREKQYEKINRKIIAEEYLENPSTHELEDYKFFCFNGVPKFVKIDFNRFVNHKANYYEINFKGENNLLSYSEMVYPSDPSHTFQSPENYNKMIELARKLSKGMTFVRVDLYNINGKIYFGELTLTPGSGLLQFSNWEDDLEIGDMMTLPS